LIIGLTVISCASNGSYLGRYDRTQPKTDDCRLYIGGSITVVGFDGKNVSWGGGSAILIPAGTYTLICNYRNVNVELLGTYGTEGRSTTTIRGAFDITYTFEAGKMYNLWAEKYNVSLGSVTVNSPYETVRRGNAEISYGIREDEKASDRFFQNGTYKGGNTMGYMGASTSIGLWGANFSVEQQSNNLFDFGSLQIGYGIEFEVSVGLLYDEKINFYVPVSLPAGFALGVLGELYVPMGKGGIGIDMGGGYRAEGIGGLGYFTDKWLLFPYMRAGLNFGRKVLLFGDYYYFPSSLSAGSSGSLSTKTWGAGIVFTSF
jgi:hypothetical protein